MIRVLIVEDDPLVAETNRHYLNSVSGFRCVGVASQAEEALAYLGDGGVDLILLDFFMPGQGGLEFLADIRRDAKGVDVIVITAASDIHHIKAALRLGAVDYLIKPFEFERFNAALKSYEREHQLMREQMRLSQAELDAVLHPPDTSTVAAAAASTELPKGLTHDTLRRTVNRIFAMKSQGFSTDELAKSVGVSRISMRKYLNFLTSIGFLTSRLDYQPAGRPMYRYYLNEARAQAVMPYLESSHLTM